MLIQEAEIGFGFFLLSSRFQLLNLISLEHNNYLIFLNL